MPSTLQSEDRQFISWIVGFRQINRYKPDIEAQNCLINWLVLGLFLLYPTYVPSNCPTDNPACTHFYQFNVKQVGKYTIKV